MKETIRSFVGLLAMWAIIILFFIFSVRIAKFGAGQSMTWGTNTICAITVVVAVCGIVWALLTTHYDTHSQKLHKTNGKEETS